MRELGLLLAMALSAGSPVAAEAERPLFTASSEHPERPRQRQERPAPAVVNLVLASIDRDEIGMLDTCLADHRLQPGDYGSLLRAVRIRAGGGRSLWFVRPALRPYCQVLYGAHLFRYFLVEEQAAARPRYRLVFQGGGDFFVVHRRQSHGLNDIEATACTARECWSNRMVYDGLRYRLTLCTHSRADNRQVARRRRCERGE